MNTRPRHAARITLAGLWLPIIPVRSIGVVPSFRTRPAVVGHDERRGPMAEARRVFENLNVMCASASRHSTAARASERPGQAARSYR